MRALVGLLAGAVPLFAEAAYAQQATEVDLGYSVLVASVTSMDGAQTLLRPLAARNIPSYLVPVTVRGEVHYRVLAGMLPDRRAAQALMTELVRAGLKERASQWDIRPTHLVVAIGTYQSAAEAGAIVASVTGKGVPAYTVPAAAGPTAFHVYAGGYESAREASYLQQRLTSLGMTRQLRRRTGLTGPGLTPPLVAAQPVPAPPPVAPPAPAAAPPSRPPPPPPPPPPPVAPAARAESPAAALAPASQPPAAGAPQPKPVPPPAGEAAPGKANASRSSGGGAMARMLGRSATFGVKLGSVYQGCFYFADSDCFDSYMSFSGGVFLDYALAGRLMGSTQVDIHGFGYDDTDTEYMIDLSLGLKAQLASRTGAIAVRPGVSVGYATRTLRDETARYLTVRAGVEIAVPTKGHVAWLVEAAAYAAPWGGTTDFNSEFGPGIMVRAGLMLF
jgi:cell division septation protein DedD